VDKPEERGRHRKVYAKGFFDGVMSILSGKGNPFMNQKKQMELLSRQTALAQKVFDATPISEPWEVSAIGRELYRLHNSAPDHRAVYGCLSALESAGLVREVKKGMFIRATVKEIVEKIEAPTEEREEVLTQKANTVDTAEGSLPLQTLAAEPMARLADIATNAKQLASQMHQLASQIEEAAIEIELQNEQAIKDSATLKQLQSLLGVGATGK
jgi:predicted transcriptional regulator